MIASFEATTVDRGGRVSEADTAAFHGVRPRLFGIAYRTLRSTWEADEVVQDAWIRWQEADRSRVRDADAFLATSTWRLAINVVHSARARHEMTTSGSCLPEAMDEDADPALDAEHNEALERAVDVLLERLSPAERAAYLLREAFDYPYRRIAELLTLNEANVRQLVSRARSRLSGGRRAPVSASARQGLAEAFRSAARTGDLPGLEELLADDVLSDHRFSSLAATA